jgi:hypothetical protein
MDGSTADRKRGSNGALVVGIMVVVLLAVGLGAFAVMKGGMLAKPTPIGEIKADLRTWDEKTVVIEGTVEAPLNLMGMKFFRLKDDTGGITVVTERGLPGEGDTVKVEGIVRQMFAVAGIEQTIVYEAATE